MKTKISLFKKMFLAILALGIATNLNAQCIAAFTYTVGSNGQVSFTNTSTGTYSNTIYQWNFGDNSTSNLPSPNHTYFYNGTYLVSMMIDSANGGCSSYIYDTIIITNSNNCNLNAAYTYTIGSNGTVSFTDASTGVNPGMTYNWSWWGSTGSGYSTQQSPSITFNYNGTYYVTMGVGDSLQYCYQTVTDTIVITNAQACQVSFTYTVGSNGQVSFTNTSQGNVSYYWNFGDGNTSTQVSPTHTYAYNGMYYVYIWADSTGGYCAGYFQDTIIITNAAPCSLASGYIYSNNGSVYVFSDTSSTNPVSTIHQWYINGSFAGYGSSFTYNFNANGIYSVCDIAIDSAGTGCSDSTCANINVTGVTCNDSVYFYMYPDSAQLSIWYIYLASNNNNYPVNAVWNWGDGTTSTGLYPTHTYTAAGWYNICVSVVYACGDSSYYCQNDSVYRTSSSMITVNVVNTNSGIKNNMQDVAALKIYPNPFTDNLTLDLSSVSGNEIAYSIYDIYGNQLTNEKVLINKGENKININTSGFSNGLYFVNVLDNTGKKSQTLKIVK